MRMYSGREHAGTETKLNETLGCWWNRWEAIAPYQECWSLPRRQCCQETTPPCRFRKESTPNDSLISLDAFAGGNELSSYGFLFKGASLLANSTENSSRIYPPVWKRLRNQH